MKKFFAAAFALFACACLGAAEILYGGLSYTQRGILTIDGDEMPVSIYVRAFENKTAMQMESPIGMLCRIEVDSYGNPSLVDTSPIFKKSWAQDYVLRDFQKIIGKKHAQSSRDYSVKFSKYASPPNSDRILPYEIEISDADYKIKLSTLSVKQ